MVHVYTVSCVTLSPGPVSTVPPETNSMQSHHILGATAGAAALVLLLIAALTLLCVLHSHKRKSGQSPHTIFLNV